MVDPGQPDAPSSEDWGWAVVAIRMIEDFDRAEFRITVEELARELEKEGLAAHRSADRLEGRSEFTHPVTPSEHARGAILARVAGCYSEDNWHIATTYLARLGDSGLEDPDQLRQQAATLLDGALMIDEMLRWYARRRAALYPSGRGHLVNDVIATIMLDWRVTPTSMARQLAAYGMHVTVGKLAMALSRQRDHPQAGNEMPPPLSVPLGRR